MATSYIQKAFDPVNHSRVLSLTGVGVINGCTLCSTDRVLDQSLFKKNQDRKTSVD